MLTAMERLARTLDGRPVDRIPVFCNLLDQGARELGVSIEEYYSRGELVAEGQVRLRERFGYDNVWALFYVAREAALFRPGKIAYAPDGPPTMALQPVQALDEVARLVVPGELRSHPAMEEPLRCLRALRREVGGRHPICVYVTASTALPALLLGMEAWLQLLLCGPFEVRDQLLAQCSALVQRELALYREEGADVLLYASPFGSTELLPERLVRELVLPWMERDLALTGTDGVVYYAGSARINPVLSLVRSRLPIRAWYLGPYDDPREARGTLGPEGLCAGTINDLRLIDGRPEEVREEVRRILAAGMPGGPFLFGTVLMPFAIPEANIRAMLDAAFEFGRVAGPGAILQ